MNKVGRSLLLLLFIFLLPATILIAESKPTDDDDGDGLSNEQEYDIWLTNPQDSDTDGDGWTDFQEVQLFDPNVDAGYFNPVVADMPKIEIILKSEPQISMEFQTSSGTSESFSTEKSNEFANSHTRSRSTSRTTGQENSYTKEVSATVEVSASLTDFGVSGSVTATASSTSSSYSEDSHSYGSDATRENRQMASSGRSKSQDNNVTNSGGEINYAVAFINPTGIAYEVESLTLATYKINPRNPLGIEMIGALSQESAFHTFQNFSIPPYSETPVMSFENGGLFVSDVLSLLEDSAGIKVVISGYKLTMDGKRFDSASTMVTAKTAQINLDFSGLEGLYPESYQVSVKTLFNPDYRSSRDMFDTVTMADILSYLYIDEARSETRVKDYNYYEGEHGGNGGLTNLRGISSTETGHWVISHSGKRRGREFKDFYSTVIESYGLDEIEVLAGDVVDIFYVEDGDQDGLSLRKENMLGSSDETAHSDDDGLTDYEEYLIGSSPILVDTDFDGYKDNEDPAPASVEITGLFFGGRAFSRDLRVGKNSSIGNAFIEDDSVIHFLYCEEGTVLASVSDDFSTVLWVKQIETREWIDYRDFLVIDEGYLVCGNPEMISSGHGENSYPGYVALYNRDGQKVWSVSSSESDDWGGNQGFRQRTYGMTPAENGNFYLLTEESGLGVWEITPEGEFVKFYKGIDPMARTAATRASFGTDKLGLSYEGIPFFFAEFNGKPLLSYKSHLYLFGEGNTAEYMNFDEYLFEDSTIFPTITEEGKLFITIYHGMDGGMTNCILLDQDLDIEWRVGRTLSKRGTPWVWEQDGQYKTILEGSYMAGGGAEAENLYMVVYEDGELITQEKLDWKISDFFTGLGWNSSNWATSGFQGLTDHNGYLLGNKSFFYYTDINGNIPQK